MMFAIGVPNGSTKHKQSCQNICQSELEKRVYLNQCDAMHASLSYKCYDHKNLSKSCLQLRICWSTWRRRPLLKLSAEKLCRDIIPVCLKPHAQVECAKKGEEDLYEKQAVVDLMRTITRILNTKLGEKAQEARSQVHERVQEQLEQEPRQSQRREQRRQDA